MNGMRGIAAALLAVLMVACAGMRGAPSAEARQGLAPTGKLRVALLSGAAHHVIKDAASGQMKGVGHDMGRELAARLGVPFEPLVYSTVVQLLNAGREGAWDVAFVGMSPERAKFLDFAGRHMDVDYGYLVPAQSRIASLAEVDRPGIRVAVVEKGSPDLHLARTLKSATLVRAPRLPGAIELVNTGKADVLAGIKANLYEVSGQVPGSRMLDGRPGSEEQALALPKGRGPQAAAYARRFVEDVKAEGLVKAAIERASLRGAVVAPGS